MKTRINTCKKLMKKHQITQISLCEKYDFMPKSLSNFFNHKLNPINKPNYMNMVDAIIEEYSNKEAKDYVSLIFDVLRKYDINSCELSRRIGKSRTYISYLTNSSTTIPSYMYEKLLNIKEYGFK